MSNQILKNTATQYFTEVEPLDEQAKAIIQEIRAKNPQPPVLGADGRILQILAPPPELAALQNQKNEIVLSQRDNFRALIGEEEFAKFSEFLTTQFAKGFIRHYLRPGEQSIRPDGENNGFTPSQRTKKGGNQ